MEAERAEKARRNAEAAAGVDHDTSSTEQSAISNGSTSNIDIMEGGFTTMFTTEDDDAHGSPTKTAGLFGDQTGNLEEGSSHSNQFASDTSPGARYRENIMRNKVWASRSLLLFVQYLLIFLPFGHTTSTVCASRFQQSTGGHFRRGAQVIELGRHE